MKSCQIMVTNKQTRLNHRQFQLATCNMQQNTRQNIIDLCVCSRMECTFVFISEQCTVSVHLFSEIHTIPFGVRKVWLHTCIASPFCSSSTVWLSGFVIWSIEFVDSVAKLVLMPFSFTVMPAVSSLISIQWNSFTKINTNT